MSGKEIYKNRELSWLQFNERVLEEAEDKTTPLLERARFLSIFTSNLDEFFRVRVGTICTHLITSSDGADDKPEKPAAVLRDILKATKKLLPRFGTAYEEILKELTELNIHQISPFSLFPDAKKLSKAEKAYLLGVFEHKIAPELAPLIITKRTLFPYFESGERFITVFMKSKKGRARAGLIPLSKELPGVFRLPCEGESEQYKFVRSEDVVLMFAHKIFRKFSVEERAVVSIIRSAEIDEHEGLYDYDLDLKDTMSKMLMRRDTLFPVKIKYSATESCPGLEGLLSQVLFVKRQQIFRYSAPFCSDSFGEIADFLPKKTREKLTFPPHIPLKNAEIDEDNDIFEQVLKKDVLLSYPFEDFSAITALLRQAAADSRTVAIHATLYRVAHRSAVVSALCAAARAGVNVTCIVELRARFDEGHNINLSKRLERSGCTVVYGMHGFKCHAKLLLITRADDSAVCMVGTGNFNETTAKIYTDLSLLTAHRGIIGDVKNIFYGAEQERFVNQSEHLLVAPLLMKNRLISLIDREIAFAKQNKPAAIVMKFNSLTEREIIEKLVEASCAGVKVDMIVRGICCLVPGVKDRTENIKVRSIVGRFLEHSRIFVFGAGERKEYYISSADLMTRNLTRRVEAAVPIYDKAVQQKLQRILDLGFSDNVKARELKVRGGYKKTPASKRRKEQNSQVELMKND